MERKKRIPGFRDFILNEQESANEGFVSSALAKLKGWAKSLYKLIEEGVIKLIPKGPKKGLPMVGYFDASNGKIEDQVLKFYKGSEFSKQNPKAMLEAESSENLEEARIPLEYTEDDQTVRDINMPELKSSIEKLYRSKDRGGRAKPIFIYGAPGIGKTQIVASAADSLGVSMLNLDLQFMAPEDFLGIPVTIEIEKPKIDGEGNMVSPGRGVTRSNPPTTLPTDNGSNGKGGIIFLDEMNRANKMVLDSTMQFVQMGRIGEYQLPDKWVIVAAGNRPAEATVADFDFAFADRFTIVNLVPKIADWAKWAREKDRVPDEVINFIERNEEVFHFLDPEKGTLKFPTPRSWVDAAAILQDEIEDEGLKSWKNLGLDKIHNIFADQIGPSAAAQLKAYLEVILKVSEKDLETMIKDPLEAMMLPKGVNHVSVMYGVSEMVVKKAIEMSEGDEPDPRDLASIMEYFNRYKNVEQLSWIYKRILTTCPDFAITQEVIDNKEEPENEAKIKAAMMVRKGASDKGLLGDN